MNKQIEKSIELLSHPDSLNYVCRQQEENHIMENIIYNELLVRGFIIDVAIVERVEEDEIGKTIYQAV